MRAFSRLLVVVVAFAGAGACTPGVAPAIPFLTGNGDQRPVEATAELTVPSRTRTTPFLDIPYPSDIDVTEDGRRIVDTFPNPTNADMLEVYREVSARQSGWGLNGSIYLRFSGPLGDGLPQPADTMRPDAAVQLVDVDPDSPERGTRIPVRLRFFAQGTMFLPENTLAALPVLGFPLRPGTTYALVVTDAIRMPNGGRAAPSDDLRALLSDAAPSDGRLTRAHAAYAPLRASGLDLGRIAHATVFTTADPLPELMAARQRVKDGAPYPVQDWTRPQDYASHGDFYVYEGTVDIPQFQQGTPPFDNYDGESGGFTTDAMGIPVVQRTERVRFALTVPRYGTMPSGGWPVTVVAHGTGGDYRTSIGDNYGDEAVWLSHAGSATLTISQPLHNTRAGFRDGAVELLTFNFLNPRAGVDNWRQSALESIALLHSLQSFAVPADISHTGQRIPLNAGPKLFFGHSQGGITGSLMLGVEPDVDLAIFSGAGGGFAESLLEKTEPLVIKEAIKLILGLPAEEDLDEFHPVLAFMQNLADPLEPLNAARNYFSDGRKAPNVLILSGLQDAHTPPRTHGPLAAAAGIPVLAPEGMPVEALVLRGIGVQGSPARANLSLSGARHATAVLAQFPDDNHFAIYRNAHATTLAARFVLSYLEGNPEAVR